MPPAASAASPEREGHDDAPGSVLLDVRACSAARGNASTASSRTSTGHPIEVTFYTARPPVLSHFNVHCPGLQLPPDDLNLAPKAIAADADPVLLRVPVHPMGKYFQHLNDYFVYSAHPQHPKLDLLPNPCPASFGDGEFAVLNCGAVANDNDRQYVVAALKMIPVGDEFTFTLHLYRAEPGGDPGSWMFESIYLTQTHSYSLCGVDPTPGEELVGPASGGRKEDER